MPCTRRLKAYRGVEGGIVFSPRDGYYDQHVELACGQCLDCRLRRARDWALRIMHESNEHSANCFLTLTYDQEHLPDDWSVDVRAWQLFAKRLRKQGLRFRYYHVGEYGGRTLRPHYHACIMGADFAHDRDHFKTSDDGHKLFVSESVTKAWPFGMHLIGDLTFDSACYVAQYVTKKQNKPKVRSLYTAKCAYEVDKRYERVDPETGETWMVKPEYATMSRGGNSAEGRKLGGIGKSHFEKYNDEIYRDDLVVSKGRKFRPPRYYDHLLSEIDNERYESVQRARTSRAIRLDRNSPANAARNRETILEAKLKQRKGLLHSN